jgi:hypothetical protein
MFLALSKLESKLLALCDSWIGAVDGSPIGIGPTCKFWTENTVFIVIIAHVLLCFDRFKIWLFCYFFGFKPLFLKFKDRYKVGDTFKILVEPVSIFKHIKKVSPVAQKKVPLCYYYRLCDYYRLCYYYNKYGIQKNVLRVIEVREVRIKSLGGVRQRNWCRRLLALCFLFLQLLSIAAFCCGATNLILSDPFTCFASSFRFYRVSAIDVVWAWSSSYSRCSNHWWDPTFCVGVPPAFIV